MFSRSWAAQVVGGLLLVAVFAPLALVVGAREASHSGPPLEFTVASAQARLEAGREFDHVRLTDLVLRCTGRIARNGKVYAGAFGEQPGPTVLVELDRGSGCQAGPVTAAGSLHRPPLALEIDLEVTGVPQVLLFRPHTGNLVELVLCVALALLGGALVGRGAWRRRAELELLRRTMEDGPVLVAEARQEGDPYRQDQGAGELLPRPLRPDERWFRRARRGSIVRATLGGLLLALGLLWAGSWALDAIRMRAVWASGERASAARVDGLRPPPVGFAAQRKPLVTFEDLAVVYTDADGVRHHGTYSRRALASPLYKGEPPEVRYDRDDPSSFALSAVNEGLRGELLLISLVLSVLVPVSLVIIRRSRQRLRELAQIRETLHSSPEEVILPVLSAHRREVKDKLVSTEYSLYLPEGTTITESFADGERPLFVELDESRVLALRRPGQPGQVVVLHEDLSPLAADEHEGERVRLRYRRSRGERPAT